MKKVFVSMLSIMLMIGMCFNAQAQGDVPTQSETDAVSSVSTEGSHIVSVTAISEVFGTGQQVSAIAVEYDVAIDNSSLSASDFTVQDKTVTKVYVNSKVEKSASSTPGNYVIVELEIAAASLSSSQGGGTGDGPGSKPAGTGDNAETQGQRAGNGTGTLASSAPAINATITQADSISTADGVIYAGSAESVASTNEVHVLVDEFQQLEYTDPTTGNSISYNLYLPSNYDESKSYPLVFFVADSGTNNNVVASPLTQGNGATVWASPEEQAKHECIVLAPQYTTTLVDTIGALTQDDHQWTKGLTLVSNLLFSVIQEYGVDESRIYGTGQSQGCMTNIAISDKYPDLFAAQFLVAGQWDVQEMSAMKDKNLWIVVCEGDTKAYPGMNAATANWESLGTDVATSDMWDSTATVDELNTLVATMQAMGCKINYTVFESGSHTYTWEVAYNIEGIRDWLFAQAK